MPKVNQDHRSRIKIQRSLAFAKRRQFSKALILTNNPQQSPDFELARADESAQSESTRLASPEPLQFTVADFEGLQQQLAQTQNRFQALYTLSPLSYVSLNANGLIVDLNPSAAKLLGGEREQFLNRAFVSFVAAHDGEMWGRLLSALQQGEVEVGQSVDISLTRMAGSPFAARLDCPVVAKDKWTLNLLLQITDITALEQRDNYLLLAAMAFEIQEGVMVTDARKTILQVNPAFTRITGFSSEEAVGQTPHLLSSGLQHEEFYQSLWQTIADNGYWQGELWNRRKNGEIYPEYLTISAITDAKGDISYYVGSFLDFSDRKQVEQTQSHQSQQALEQQLQQKNAELEQIKRELDDINIALKVLVQHQQDENLKIKKSLGQEINQEIIPFLSQLKKGYQDSKQVALLRILEANLQHLVESTGTNDTLSRFYQELTPKEIQVAVMIRDGFSSKQIAATSCTSTGTVNAHRKNIRKKLGLNNEAINLRNYLLNMQDPI